MSDQPLTILEEEMNLQLLRYAVGRAMFCPSCDRVLDVRRAVLVTPKDGVDGPAGIACGDCWDAVFAKYSAVEQAAFMTRADVVDGRTS